VTNRAKSLPEQGITWRDVVAKTAPAMQNKSKREAIRRMLLAHPDWSNRRIARSVHLIVITDDDLDLPVVGDGNGGA
jgi:hypothetical protein